MSQRTVTVTDTLDAFIDTSIQSGRFSSASEMVEEGLRLVQQQQREEQLKLEWLRTTGKSAFEALDRGEYVTLSTDEDIDNFIKQTAFEQESVRV